MPQGLQRRRDPGIARCPLASGFFGIADPPCLEILPFWSKVLFIAAPMLTSECVTRCFPSLCAGLFLGIAADGISSTPRGLVTIADQ